MRGRTSFIGLTVSVLNTVVFSGLLTFVYQAAGAQTPDTTQVAAGSGLTVTGYVEAYYAHDFTAPKTRQERPGFLYNHRRNREVTHQSGFC